MAVAGLDGRPHVLPLPEPKGQWMTHWTGDGWGITRNHPQLTRMERLYLKGLLGELESEEVMDLVDYLNKEERNV